MQQTKMALGGILAAGILSAAAAAEQQCFTNIRNLLSAGTAPNVEYLCENFEQAIKEQPLLSPCGTPEQAYDLFSLLCTTSTQTPTEQIATPVTTWTAIATLESNPEDITVFEAATLEATPSEADSAPTTFVKITGCTSHDHDDVLDAVTATNDDPTTGTATATGTETDLNEPDVNEADVHVGGGLSAQDIRAFPVLIASLGLCALLW